jgi:hypothetical protein
MTGFIALFITARDYILHFTITPTLVSKVTSSLAVAWQRLPTADVPLILGSRTILSLSYQLLTATAHND